MTCPDDLGKRKQSFPVNCGGTEIGSLDVIIDEPFVDQEAGFFTLGQTMIAGFKSNGKDHKEKPCCCSEFRFSQAVQEDSNGFFQKFLDGDADSKPFYYTDEERKNNIDENGYDITFYDFPRTSTGFYEKQKKRYWFAELCLMCVNSEKKTIRPLSCFKWGHQLGYGSVQLGKTASSSGDWVKGEVDGKNWPGGWKWESR